MRALSTVALFAAMLAAPALSGQTIDGDVVGAVFDTAGAAVPNASIALENVATGVKSTAASAADGSYRFNNVPVGTYTVAVSATSFAGALINGVQVELNKTTTVSAPPLQPAQVKTNVTVVEEPALLNTTTAQIASTYSAREATDLAVATNAGNGTLNFSLLSGGVASSGGVGAGAGPSVGGQRPRSNNFTVEGVDNNRKDITGPAALVPSDSVAEFSLLQNIYSAEFGHSAGGQFNTVIKNGTNDLHGSLFEYSVNRDLKAQDQANVRQGISNPRYDNNRFGGEIGGPIRRNSLFYYGLAEYNPVGSETSVVTSVDAPTAAGYQTLATTPGVSQTNLGVLEKYLPPAPVANDGTTPVGSVNIPLGATPLLAPAYYNFYNYVGALDDTISSTDQLRLRYINNRQNQIDSAANIGAFWSPRLTTSDLVSLSEFHTFHPNLLNEVRLAYDRFDSNTQAPNISYPGLSQFPNILINNDLGVQIGPDVNAPQRVVQNTYQLIDNLSWVKGRHDIKFGIDLRDQISASTYIQYQRGDYEYLTMGRFLLDQAPDIVARRTAGDVPYSGDANGYYAFLNDNWRVSDHLSLNLGVRYEYNGIAKSMNDFANNAAANVPGVLTFFAPQAQKLNFAPRFGLAYSPGHKANTTIRGGFGIGYDPIFDNVGTNVRPPQDATLIQGVPAGTINFLGNGGIPGTLPNFTLAQLRQNTTGWLPNQELGYAMNWSLGVQHEFAHDFTLEVREVGSKGVHLLEQTELNRNAVVTPELYLPTFLQAPSQATLNALPVTLTQLNALKAQNNPLASSGFTSTITSYEPLGNSIYNGLATELKKRFSHRLQFIGAYTWSHMRDDSTAEVNTTALTPRRPQDFGNLKAEWANSALDRRNRGTATWIWETPWFDRSQNRLLRYALGGYQLSGSYIVESPEYVTPQGFVDANLNSDTTSDRTIVNPNGVPGTGSGVTSLKNSSGGVVGYLATNPSAQYILAQAGALATAGRNTLATPRINNWDITAFKNFALGERFKLQFRADFFNAFNHPQYTPGLLDDINPVNRSSTTAVPYLIPGNPAFAQWNQVFSSNPRSILLGVKLRF